MRGRRVQSRAMSSQSGFLTAPGGFGVATRTPSLALGTGLQAGTGLEWCEPPAGKGGRVPVR